MSGLPQYIAISTAYALGTLRLLDARVASLSLEIALINFHVLEAKDIPKDINRFRFATALQGVSPSEYSNYHRVTAASHLVYATALFDSYLTDTTRFLMLRDPAKLGSRTPIYWETFLNLKARSSTIVQLVTKRTREIAFWPFLRRIEFLNKTFGLKASLDSSLLKDLEQYSGIRNAIVHDHALAEPGLADNDEVIIRQRRLGHHDLKSNDVRVAMRTYALAAKAVFSEVCERVFGAAGQDQYNQALEELFFPSRWAISLADPEAAESARPEPDEQT